MTIFVDFTSTRLNFSTQIFSSMHRLTVKCFFYNISDFIPKLKERKLFRHQYFLDIYIVNRDLHFWRNETFVSRFQYHWTFEILYSSSYKYIQNFFLMGLFILSLKKCTYAKYSYKTHTKSRIKTQMMHWCLLHNRNRNSDSHKRFNILFSLLMIMQINWIIY